MIISDIYIYIHIHIVYLDIRVFLYDIYMVLPTRLLRAKPRNQPNTRKQQDIQDIHEYRSTTASTPMVYIYIYIYIHTYIHIHIHI